MSVNDPLVVTEAEVTSDAVLIGRELGIPPCPTCGEPLGARYEGLCWPCWEQSHPPAPPERPPRDPSWIVFRKRIIDALERVDATRFVYLDHERILGACPVCRAALPEYLAVRFHGRAPRADLDCSLGCPEALIAAAIRELTGRKP